jgi:hypothetical protein
MTSLMITYIYVMYRGGHNSEEEEITVTLQRPSWWSDATIRQRRATEKLALNCERVMSMREAGWRVSDVIRPPCECIVQQVEERDPWLRGAGGICTRCFGPLP